MVNELIRGEWNDPAKLIIGEWGITLEDACPPPSGELAMSRLFDSILAYLEPDIMIYFSHHYVNEIDEQHPELSTGQWGLRCYNQDPGEFRLCTNPVPPCTWCPNPDYQAGAGRTLLYHAFTSVLAR